MIVPQEEEESPADGGKDEPGEQAELKGEAEAPSADETTQPPAPEPEADTGPEATKATDKETGDKPEALVS